MKKLSRYWPVSSTACLALLAFGQQSDTDLKASMTRGKALYGAYCQSCHADQGQGIEGVFPPLAKSDYLMADRKRAIQSVLYGVSGEIKVNGQTYNQPMAGFDGTDEQVSDILNYIRNSFGNKGGAISLEEVKAVRKPSGK
jgi:nitrite reductase (NO-forming)